MGEDIRRNMVDAPHEVGGFFEGLATAGYEAVPIFLARAIPYGVIESSAFEYLVEQLLVELERADLLDAILAAPHGATVAENHPDADGYWLGKVRKVVGPDLPIVATVDPHANLSQAMIEATHAIISYETNPHLDQRATGRRAADLLTRILRDEIHPVQVAAFPPMAINIQSQETSTTPTGRATTTTISPIRTFASGDGAGGATRFDPSSRCACPRRGESGTGS